MRGSVTVITPPDPVLDVETVRSRLGLSVNDGDGADLAAYIATATTVLDAPDGWLGRAIGEQTLEWALPSLSNIHNNFASFYDSHYFPSHHTYRERFDLPFPPITTISSVTYVDQNGVTQTIDPSLYSLSGRRLRPIYGTNWPSGRIDDGSVKIRYIAGYETAKIPPPIIQAIVLMVGKMKSMLAPDMLVKTETVAGVGSTTWSAADLPMYDQTINNLLSPYRVFT
jgi:hypothetical protein